MGKLLQKMRRGKKNTGKKKLDWTEFEEDYESDEEYYGEDEEDDYGDNGGGPDEEAYYEDDEAWETDGNYEDDEAWETDGNYEDDEVWETDGDYEDDENWETDACYEENGADGQDAEEYYEDEEAYEPDGDEYYEDDESYEIDGDLYSEDDAYYEEEDDYEADDEENYEDEEYCEDGEAYESEDEEYYEDEEAYESEDEEYYEDEEAYESEDEEYYEDEGAYESDDEYYEDDEEDYEDDDFEIDEDEEEYDDDYDDEEDEEYDDDDDVPEGVMGKAVYKLTHMSAVDYIIALTSAAVLILAVVTGTMYLGAKSSQAQIETFAEIGVGIEDIHMIGESGLVAIADAQASRLAAAETEAEQEEDQEEEKEQEKAGDTEVVMNLTSIQKDLKIKFINKKTGKLIPNIEFEVEVKTPSGNTVTYKDDDKDGIIYKTDIEPGKYKVKIISPASDSTYQISTEETAITVRDKIEYKKVDVSDEVKTEAQVNVAVEDTKVNETVVESTNTDTVEWVESTKTLIDGTEETEEGYEKIDRSSIADPAQQASAGFRLLTGIDAREPDAPTEEEDEQNPPKEEETPEPEKPTAEPTQAPEPEPDPTAAPTEKPVEAPPTAAPTEKPTAAPTAVPTQKPTPAPEKPTEKPAPAPTEKPTAKPTPAPTGIPTQKPTPVPTAAPTGKPTAAPTATAKATASPTVSPSAKPSGSPAPSATPTATPKNLKEDTTSVLKTTSGEVLYVKDGDGHFREAKYADYYNSSIKEFYRKVSTTKGEYRYTGWQEIDGVTYFFDKNGNKVTGEQVIQGAKYTFNSDGSLNTGSGHLGIDVSKWNGNIDWNAVKNSGVSYVIIRCGYRGSTTGALIEDPMFRSNIKGASAAGLKVGVYFFTQAVNEVEAVEEASMVLGLIKGYNISYPVFLDVEPSNGRGDKIDAGTRTAVCRAFCQTIQNSGYKSGIYANKTWLNSYVDAPSLASYKIWLAQYAAAPSYSKTKYDMWQYSSKGKVAGISGSVDMNISYMGY